MPSVNEQLQDESIRHAIDLMAHANTVVRRIIADLNFADPKLFAAITEALERVPLDEFTVPRLTRALAEARDINAMAYETVEAALNVELRELVKYEANYQATLFRAQMAGVPIKAVDFGAAYAAANSTPFRGRLMKEWAVSLGTDRMRRIEDALRIGYVEQKTVGDMVRTIRGTRAARYADGLLQTDRRNAEAIARTALSHYAGVTRDRFYEQNSDIIKEIVWLSVLDSRTTPQCVVRDGKHYTMDTDGHYRPKGHEVPWGEGPGRLHWNCRSTSYPVTNFWQSLGVKPPPSTRASMDGQVPDTTTYLEWITKQNATVQNEVLGKTRGEMLRSGKFKVERFFNNEGRFLTLDELRARDERLFALAA